MYGYIYLTENIINGKKYIGKKVSNKFLHEKYLGSGKLMRMAIEKYGKENFKVNLIDTAQNKIELCDKEKYWIDYYNATTDTNYYNIKDGGEGGAGPRSQNTKQKISNWNLDSIRIHKDDILKKVSKKKLNDYLQDGWVIGWPKNYFKRTDEWKNKIKTKTTGKKLMVKNNKRIWVNPDSIDEKLNDGWELYINNSWCYKSKRIDGAGKCKFMNKDGIYKLVPESRWNEFLSNGWNFGGKSKGKGRIAPNKGKKASEETKKKLSDSHKGHKNSSVSIQKQADAIRGRKFIHKNDKLLMVNIEDIKEYLLDGWLPRKNEAGLRSLILELQNDYKKLLEKGINEKEAENQIIEKYCELLPEQVNEAIHKGELHITY